MGPFTLIARSASTSAGCVVLDGLARRNACEVHHCIDPAEVLEGRRRQRFEARWIGDVRSQVNRRIVAPAGYRCGVALAPRREHQPEALGREEPGQGVTKSSGHSDKNCGRRICAPFCYGPARVHRSLFILLGHHKFLSVDISCYKRIYFEQKNTNWTSP